MVADPPVDNPAPALGTTPVKQYSSVGFANRLGTGVTPRRDPGDTDRTMVTSLTSGNKQLSTIHSPYYRSCKISFFSYEERRAP